MNRIQDIIKITGNLFNQFRGPPVSCRFDLEKKFNGQFVTKKHIMLAILCAHLYLNDLEFIWMKSNGIIWSGSLFTCHWSAIILVSSCLHRYLCIVEKYKLLISKLFSCSVKNSCKIYFIQLSNLYVIWIGMSCFRN